MSIFLIAETLKLLDILCQKNCGDDQTMQADQKIMKQLALVSLRIWLIHFNQNTCGKFKYADLYTSFIDIETHVLNKVEVQQFARIVRYM